MKRRVCLDPRNINKILVDDKYPLPIIYDVLSKLQGAVVITTLDDEDAYGRMGMSKESKGITAFTHNGVQYIFNRAPFGLKTLTATFQRIQKIILHGLDYAQPFRDDILIMSTSFDEHVGHVREVLRRCTAHNLRIKWSKAVLAVSQVYVLGHCAGIHGVSIDYRKLTDIATWTKPKTPKQLASQLGLWNYFRDYIPLYAALSEPLEHLRSDFRTPDKWTHDQHQSWDSIVAILPQAMVRHYPDFEQPFSVSTDASKRGIGAVLWQGCCRNSAIVG